MQTLRQVPLYAYCSKTRVWQALTASPGDTSAPPARFTCVTYNVFSGSLSRSIPHALHRTKQAIEVLSRSKSDVIAIQEASLAFEQALRRERWLRQDWYITSLHDYFTTASSTANVNKNDLDGCIMAIRKTMCDKETQANMYALPGQQGKVLVILRAAGGIHFATSHFESLASSERTRLHQYNHLVELVKPIPSCVILADFNHSSYGELKVLVGSTNAHVPAGQFKDCGIPSHQLESKQPANKPPPIDSLRDNATFGELYPFFEGSRRKEKRKPRRLDLVLVKGDNLRLVKQWTDGHKAIQIDRRDRPRDGEEKGQKKEQKSQKVKLRCQQGKGGNAYASDHLAVLATFELV